MNSRATDLAAMTNFWLDISALAAPTLEYLLIVQAHEGQIFLSVADVDSSN